ncbi:NUDIX domain-containing protein [Micromonospora zingiberis]|uniref:NUDIX domain-containing protein n=1 Tax=Micromonospora zingiberis TaxID=2053011 RepID=A0A4R0GU29_9ACTN|nr:NUDIX domain-containing protein [Micromonospora zingiberis]TCC00174.1 NUDIX domain-containing protein [Micromonospora zingiberis]
MVAQPAPVAGPPEHRSAERIDGMENAVVRAVCGAVIQDTAGRVLLMRRNGEGTWGLPGGGVEPGETWEQATLRECQEETGWQVNLRGLLGVYSDPATQLHRYPSGLLTHFFGVVFLADPRHRVGEPDGEASELGWFALDRLPEPVFAPDVPVLRDAAGYDGYPFIR